MKQALVGQQLVDPKAALRLVFNAMASLVIADLTPESVSRTLSLDLSRAHVTRATGGRGFIVAEATREAFSRHPGIVAFVSLNALSIVLLEEERLRDAPGLIEGERPRVQRSRHALGFASLAFLNGATVGCCVDD